MMIELGKYNEIGELLIDNRTTGSQGHVGYQDGDQRVSVTGAAVHMGGRWGCEQGTGAHTISLQVGNESRYTYNCCGEIKEALACNKMVIDGKERGWDPQVPGPLARWPATTVAWVALQFNSNSIPNKSPAL